MGVKCHEMFQRKGTGMIYQFRDTKLYYEEIGSGKPIVMIHGFSLDLNLMKGCMEPFFKKHTNYKRIYLDLPGMGKSDAPEWIKNSDDMLDFVISFIHQILPDENFILAGESYGGYLARGVVYQLKDQIDGLFLLCPVVIPDSNLREVPNHYVIEQNENFVSGLGADDAKEFCESFVIQNEYTYQRFKSEIQSGITAANPSFLNKIKQNYSFSFDVDDKKHALFIKPALLLAGRQDSSVGYQDLFKIIENYPRAAYAVLDGAGHNLQIEQRHVFDHLLNDWFLRMETYSSQNE